MKIELHFPTPIYTHDTEKDELSSFYSEIDAIVEKEYQKILLQEDARSRHYTQSRDVKHRRIIHEYTLENFHLFLLKHCKALLSKLYPDASAIDVRESWFNFYEPGDFQEFHNHVHPTTPSYLSGVFYWQAEENCGDLKIYQPNLSNAVAVSNGGLEKNEISYTPRSYRLILFRSHVPHAIMPNNSGAQRVSISFNIYVQ